jgi:hypothetical protein
VADTPVLNPKLTKAALAAIASNSGTGFALTLTHIAVGQGQLANGVYSGYAPTGDEVALKSEAARYTIGGGTKPTPTSIQTGTTITDTDPQGRSANGLSINEIGWFGTTPTNPTPILVALWSRATGGALFVKAQGFDVPFAYTMDISDFPANGVTVTVGTDPQGMATLILQHEAKADPHTQYVQKARGMGEYDVKTVYASGAKVTGPDGKTYRSIADNNVNNTPATSPAKWERWGHSVAELAAEFIPVRTGTLDVNTGEGIARIENPDGALLYVASAAAVGAFKIALPVFQLAGFVRMRVEILAEADRRPMTAIISGTFNTDGAWSVGSAEIIGASASNDLAVRLGNDGAKMCVWIGETNTLWAYPRLRVTEVVVARETASGAGAVARWMKGWAVSLGQSFGTVQKTISGTLVFGQTDINHVAGLADILATKQGGLGYVPVQQGGGIGQATNKVYIGWSDAGQLKATVDTTDLGGIALLNSPFFTGSPKTITALYGATGFEIANAMWVTTAIRAAQIGQIIFEPRLNARAGYLLCNGAELSRTTYAELWSMVLSGGLVFQESDWLAGYWGGFGYGPGGPNGSTFRIPELRGEFLRCHDFGRGRDSGRPYPGHFQTGQNVYHAHGGAIAAVGDHAHSAYTDAQGYHSHTGGTYGAGGHNHNNGGYTRLLRPPYGGSITGSDTNGSGSEQAVGGGDSADIVGVGDHGHTLSIDANGNHGHAVGVNGAGNHTHGLSIYADGGNEPRPHNVSIGAFIRVI